MQSEILYKYLDFEGGYKMLENSNLQFTNATQLNDPFDCHPSLIDFSNVPEWECELWPRELIESVRKDGFRRNRDLTWICSLSKNHDSILMWSYYSRHNGVCIGLNMTEVRKYYYFIQGRSFSVCQEVEVQYKDIIDKPDYFGDAKDFFHYQLSTKANAWEHEQEVRLFVLDPKPSFMIMRPPSQDCDEEPIDWRKMRAYPEIGRECFESVYLGDGMTSDEKSKIIKAARGLNPDIKIYQIKMDANAFKLIAEPVG